MFSSSLLHDWGVHVVNRSVNPWLLLPFFMFRWYTINSLVITCCDQFNFGKGGNPNDVLNIQVEKEINTFHNCNNLI